VVVVSSVIAILEALVALVAVVAVSALPARAAVMMFAVKLPDASRATMALAVFA